MSVGRFELPSAWESYATKMHAQFLVSMDPMEFIEYTTPPGSAWKQKILEHNRFTYEEYLKFRNTTTPPILLINLDKKRIRDHEGRHRAMAYHRSGGKDFCVLIALDPTEENVKISKIISGMFKSLFKPYQTITWKTLPNIQQQFTSKLIDIPREWKLEKELIKL